MSLKDEEYRRRMLAGCPESPQAQALLYEIKLEIGRIEKSQNGDLKEGSDAKIARKVVRIAELKKVLAMPTKAEEYIKTQQH
jgi:hypothetical protein